MEQIRKNQSVIQKNRTEKNIREQNRTAKQNKKGKKIEQNRFKK